MSDAPSCPDCGEPVGRRATYCMHCGASIGSEAEAADAADADDGPAYVGPFAATSGRGLGTKVAMLGVYVSVAAAVLWLVGYPPGQAVAGPVLVLVAIYVLERTGLLKYVVAVSRWRYGRGRGTDPEVAALFDEGTDDESAALGASVDGDAIASGAATVERDGTGGGVGAAGADEDDGLDRWFGPDGIVDDSLTVAVAVVVGVLCGVAALLIFGAVAGGWSGLLGGAVAFVGLTACLARQPSVFGAVRGGCYALSVALVGLPLVALTDATQGGTVGGQVVLFLVAELLFVPVAAVLAGIGYRVGKRRPDGSDGDSASR